MKTCIVFSLIVFSCLMVQANIFIPPAANVSELYFDNNDQWYLEISYFDGKHDFGAIDSILVFTPHSKYKLNCPFDSTQSMDYMVISSLGVGDSLVINPLGDSICVKTYWNNPDADFLGDEHCLIFGDFNGSEIQKPDEGCSICYFNNFKQLFIEHPQPSLGEENKTGIAFAYLSGKMFDDESLILRGWFGIDFQFYLNKGSFIVPVMPGSPTITQISYIMDKDYSQQYVIQPLSFDARPGDTIYLDIHITDPNFVTVDEEKEKKGITVFPNPATQQVTINFETARISKKAIKIELYNMEGKLVLQKLLNYSSSLHFNVSRIPAGIYSLRVKQDKELLANKKIIVNPF